MSSFYSQSMSVSKFCSSFRRVSYLFAIVLLHGRYDIFLESCGQAKEAIPTALVSPDFSKLHKDFTDVMIMTKYSV